MVIKRVGPVSCAKIAGLGYALMGFIIGCFMSLFSLVGGLASAKPEGMFAGAIFGVGAIFILPFLYGIGGFVFTLIGAWFYNVLAKMMGGVVIEVE